jgi:1,2-dihydroxy-3-keto-5-methylthiopentene dioxygenase
MTSLTIYDEAAPADASFASADLAEILTLVAGLGVRYEHIDESPLPADATADDVLAAYGDLVRRENSDFGYRSADVVSVSPATPNHAALRAKFLEEHIHGEDEARFMVAGSGAFYLHLNGKVFVLEATKGDLISVPAGVKHWFDMGATPLFTSLRFFTNPDGWAAQFTGDPIAQAIPRYEGPS